MGCFVVSGLLLIDLGSEACGGWVADAEIAGVIAKEGGDFGQE